MVINCVIKKTQNSVLYKKTLLYKRFQYFINHIFMLLCLEVPFIKSNSPLAEMFPNNIKDESLLFLRVGQIFKIKALLNHHLNPY